MVSKEKAKELGLEIRAKSSGPDAVSVELEFELTGEFTNYERVDLEFGDPNKFLVTSSLKEESAQPGNILVRFVADRANLHKITLCVIARGGSP